MSELVILRENDKVEKRNVLNQMRGLNWTLQELRFFMLYLSKIDARNPETREVRFALSEFAKIMDLPRAQAKDIKPIAIRLLQKIVEVPQFRENGKPTGGYDLFQLFSRCKVREDEESGEWCIEFNAHDESLPLMFEFKEKYVTYGIKNVLRLKGVNQFRMYEVLKQYEYAGEVVFSVTFLRNLFDVKKDEYTLWKNFRVRVLDNCQKVLEEKTDIKYTYEQIKKGRKIDAVKFTIMKNTLDEDEGKPKINKKKKTKPEQAKAARFDTPPPEPKPTDVAVDPPEPEVDERRKEYIEFLGEACDNAFTCSQTEQLQYPLNRIIPYNRGNQKDQYDYLANRYIYAKSKSTKPGENALFNYLKKVLEAEAKEAEAERTEKKGTKIND